MGTSNFYNKNASKVFAVLMDYEQFKTDENGNETEETETVSAQEWDLDNFLSFFAEKLNESKFNPCVPKTPMWEPNSNRNFEGVILGELSSRKTYGGLEIKVEIQAIKRNGYYEGANLDWNCLIKIDGYEMDGYEFKEEFVDKAETYYNMKGGLAKIIAPKAYKWALKTKDTLIDEIERIFTEISTPLVRVATFSNGETIYQQV